MTYPIDAPLEPLWIRFQELVRDRFPHGKIYDVRIASGAVVSFERVRHTRAFGAPAGRAKPGVSDRWRAFMEFCRGAGEVLIPEVHFRDGEPVLVQLEEPGVELRAPAT